MPRPEALMRTASLGGEVLSPKEAHLVRSAYKVMGEKGMGGLSLQDVADEAGVSKAILPYYFESKENLILLTMRWVLARATERIRTAISGTASAEEKVSAMVDAVFSDPESDRGFYLVFFDFLGYAARNDRFGDVGATFHANCTRLYAEVVKAGQEEGAFVGRDPEEAAAVVRALVDGMFVQWIQEKGWRDSHERRREACKRAVLAYLTSGA